MNVEWNCIPVSLITPNQGTLTFNPQVGAGGAGWLLDQDNCKSGAGKRLTRDHAAQHSGDIVHRKYKDGYVVQLSMWAAEMIGSGPDMKPVSGSALVNQMDALMRHLDDIENRDGVLRWTPTSHSARAVQSVRWMGPDGSASQSFSGVDVEYDDEVFLKVTFALLAPFPYAQDAAETVTAIGGGAFANNTGTTEFWPVIRVFGPTTAFTITNIQPDGTTVLLQYDSTLPGAQPILAGRAVELDFFRNTAYEGPAAGPYTGDNMKPGIVIQTTDFWSLKPGVNAVGIGGATANMLWAPAYTG